VAATTTESSSAATGPFPITITASGTDLLDWVAGGSVVIDTDGGSVSIVGVDLGGSTYGWETINLYKTV